MVLLLLLLLPRVSRVGNSVPASATMLPNEHIITICTMQHASRALQAPPQLGHIAIIRPPHRSGCVDVKLITKLIYIRKLQK
jgi:hypothetical protein